MLLKMMINYGKRNENRDNFKINKKWKIKNKSKKRKAMELNF